MREILFRGKRKYFPGGWVYGWYQPPVKWGNHNFGTSISHFCDEGWLDDTEVIPETVGQFTGLIDKNGKKIFEGDIVRVCLDPEICTARIQYDDRTASFNLRYNDYQCNTFLDMRLAENRVGDKVWVEVIGNIHDNPELLGGAEDGK